jgi:hypothetical protein
MVTVEVAHETFTMIRCTLVIGAAMGLLFAYPELTPPYMTVSDVLETSVGGPLLYASWTLAHALWVTRVSATDAYALIGSLIPTRACVSDPHRHPHPR